MRHNIFGILATAGLILFGSASCVPINEQLGDNFIPTDQIWNVFPCEDVALQDVTIKQSDSLSGYSTSRITFGSIKDGEFGCNKSSCFTLVPLLDTIDFGTNPEVIQFHFTAVRDTFSVLRDNDMRMLQNVYVHSLKEALDSTVLYTGTFANKELLEKHVNTASTITNGVPIYNGGDSLSFDFSKEFAEKVIAKIDEAQRAGKRAALDFSDDEE